ncbi:hypothetical protein RI367_003421 [Sorochytrium milnesiophthora]
MRLTRTQGLDAQASLAFLGKEGNLTVTLRRDEGGVYRSVCEKHAVGQPPTAHSATDDVQLLQAADTHTKLTDQSTIKNRKKKSDTFVVTASLSNVVQNFQGCSLELHDNTAMHIEAQLRTMGHSAEMSFTHPTYAGMVYRRNRGQELQMEPPVHREMDGDRETTASPIRNTRITTSDNKKAGRFRVSHYWQ